MRAAGAEVLAPWTHPGERAGILCFRLPGEDPANLADDMPLRTSGVLDSMSTLRLVQFVEERFGITIEAHEAGVENFDRVDDMVAFVRRKLGT